MAVGIWAGRLVYEASSKSKHEKTLPTSRSAAQYDGKRYVTRGGREEGRRGTLDDTRRKKLPPLEENQEHGSLTMGVSTAFRLQ